MKYKVGIICASDDEFTPFIEHMENVVITEKAMLSIYEGEICGIRTVALFSGVCKVNAAIAAEILIDTFHADIIINCGVAGGMNDDLEIFDTVVSERVCYHDVADDILTEFHPWMKSVWFLSDEKLLQLSHKAAQKKDYRVYFGSTVTGEAFISDEGRYEINEKYSPLSTDMETAAIAHVCYVNKIPFIAIRTITDTQKKSGLENFELNCKKASVIAKDLTLALICEIKESDIDFG